jgi:hypothetical protein
VLTIFRENPVSYFQLLENTIVFPVQILFITSTIESKITLLYNTGPALVKHAFRNRVFTFRIEGL